MAIVFFIEIYQTQPNFSSKIDQNDVISIYPSLNKEVAEQNNGKHKDIGYSAKIDACIEFDCSGFVVGRNATGKIDLCVDCPTPQQPTAPNPAGNCASYAALNSYLNNLPAQVTNSNPATATAYSTHLQNATYAAGARSGYWLGLTDCDSVAGQYQCGVSCKTGAVALCYPTLGAPKDFGSVHTASDGESYQIYDPVQLHASGVSSTTGMSFAMGTSVPNWLPGGTCGGPATRDLSGSNSSNCFETGSAPSNYNSVGGQDNPIPTNTYTAQTPQSTFNANNILVTGIPASGSTSIGIGDQCFYIGGSPSSGGGGGLLLGGSSSGKSVVSLESLGGSSYGNCNDCAENISLPCESLASSQISINGAPKYNTATGWGSGSTVWDNYNQGDPNADGYPLAFKETTCAMDDTLGLEHGALGDGARAIVPNIPCIDPFTKKCKPGHKPGPIWVESVITPPSKCCQNVTVGRIYQSFNNDCRNCCDSTRGSNIFVGPVYSGFGCPCDGKSEEDCYYPNFGNNLDCQKPGEDGYTPVNSDPAGGEKTSRELSLCRQYGNEVIGPSSTLGASIGPKSWVQMTVERICNNNPASEDHSCNVTFIAFFEVSSSGEADLPGIIGNDENGDPPTNSDGTLVEPCTVGDLKEKLGALGASDISLFLNVNNCFMAGSPENPWSLYGNGDITVGGENANPSTPDGTGGVKPVDDPDSPYGNEDDGKDCG